MNTIRSITPRDSFLILHILAWKGLTLIGKLWKNSVFLAGNARRSVPVSYGALNLNPLAIQPGMEQRPFPTQIPIFSHLQGCEGVFI
jgi:hypothetical protein